MVKMWCFNGVTQWVGASALFLMNLMGSCHGWPPQYPGEYPQYPPLPPAYPIAYPDAPYPPLTPQQQPEYHPAVPARPLTYEEWMSQNRPVYYTKVSGKSAGRAPEAKSGTEDIFPETKSAVPNQKDAIPETKSAVPAQKDAIPETKDVAPETTLPAAPTKKDAIPETKASYPEAKDAVPTATTAHLETLEGPPEANLAPPATTIAPAATTVAPAATTVAPAATTAAPPATTVAPPEVKPAAPATKSEEATPQTEEPPVPAEAAQVSSKGLELDIIEPVKVEEPPPNVPDSKSGALRVDRPPPKNLEKKHGDDQDPQDFHNLMPRGDHFYQPPVPWWHLVQRGQEAARYQQDVHNPWQLNDLVRQYILSEARQKQRKRQIVNLLFGRLQKPQSFHW